MPIIKAEQLAKGAHFVLPAGDSAGRLDLFRSNATTISVSAAEVDRLFDEHDELEQLRARLAEYEARGPLVDLGAEETILVNASAIAMVKSWITSEVGMPLIQSVVVLARDGMGIASVVPFDEIVSRIGEAKRRLAERGH
jgi:hypothetical protein